MDTKYAFHFDAYNGMLDDSEGYRSHKDSLDIYVVSSNETDALVKAKAVVDRTDWKLEDIYEVLAAGERLAR